VQRYKKIFKLRHFSGKIQEKYAFILKFLGFFFLISEKSCYFAPRKQIKEDESIQ